MADDIEMLAELAASGARTRELLEAVRDRIGLGGAMEMLDGSKGSEATASHLDDLEGLIQVADLHDEPGGFEPWLRAALEASAGGEGVRLATVHRVKGREWDRVAVYGADQGLMPHRLSESWEAERRVLHVAITRARHRCVVLADAERASPFLAEIRGEAEEAATKPAVTHRRARRRDLAVAARDRPRRRLAARRRRPGRARAADEALREWRKLRSDEDGVPAYVVLSNKQLEGIAAAMPEDERGLLACNGIGPTKLERYGEDILAVLATVRLMELVAPARARRGRSPGRPRRSSPTPAGSTAAMATFGFASPASRRLAWTIAVVAEAALAVGVAAGSDRAAYLAAALMLAVRADARLGADARPGRGAVRLLRRRLDGRGRRRRPRPAARGGLRGAAVALLSAGPSRCSVAGRGEVLVVAGAAPAPGPAPADDPLHRPGDAPVAVEHALAVI